MNNEFAEELGMNRSLNIMRSYLHRLAEIVEDEGESRNVGISLFVNELSSVQNLRQKYLCCCSYNIF